MAGLLKIVIAVLLLFSPGLAQPRHLYLTWEHPDTARTQTVVFQTVGRAIDPKVEFLAEGQTKAKSFQAKTKMLETIGRRIHWVTLTGLEPGTTYRFRAGDKKYGMSSWHTFRTLPDDERSLKILTGGDMYRHPETVQLLQVGRKLNPDVVLIGGDLAYDDGNINNYPFWDDWFDNWAKHLNQKDGRMVAIIAALGNHEVRGHFGQPKARAPFFFAYFPQGPEPYFQRKLGREIDLIVLDTGHVTSHQAQVPFLEKALKESKARFQIALYHVPCYPTHRPYEDYYSAQGRKHWVPIFDRHDLDIGLENHDHVFKRTHPLRANKIDPAGTVYLGDGCWGMGAREVVSPRWYHQKAQAKEHIWLLQNEKNGIKCEAYDIKGRLFDRVIVKE